MNFFNMAAIHFIDYPEVHINFYLNYKSSFLFMSLARAWYPKVEVIIIYQSNYVMKKIYNKF